MPRNDLQRSQTPYLNVACWGQGSGYVLAQTIEKRNLLSKESRLASNMEEQFQHKRLNYNTRRRQQRASENEEKRKESFKIRNKKDRDNNGRRNETINSRDPC